MTVATEAARRLREAGCVFADDEVALLREASLDDAHFDAMLERRIAGGAIEHIVGFAKFRGHRFAVEPGVFVPRLRSELLVEVASELVEPGALVVEPCCGSGAIGATVARSSSGVQLHATDIDPVAVRCATQNLDGMGTAYVGDLFDALPMQLQGRVDLVVANAPYVPSEDVALLPRDARDHERLAALDGGPDGLDVMRRIVAEAPGWLRDGGVLLVEATEAQARDVLGEFADAGFAAYVRRDDELDATVVVGRYAPGGMGLS